MTALLAIARADFRQRVRSFRFLAVLMATVVAALLMLPTRDAGYVVLDLGGARGTYNAAWIGLVFGVVGAMVMPLFGFFIVKDAVQRDRATRVGALLAAAPLSRLRYLGAKFLSNVSIFGAILAVCTLVAFAMQFWRGEDRALHPLDLLVHLWAIPLPMILMTAAIALFFECVPGLRGAFGNVVFFFLWFAVLFPGIEGMTPKQGRIVERGAELIGISAPLADFEDRLDIVAPNHERGLSIGADIGKTPQVVLDWPGIAGDRAWLAQRVAWSFLFVPLLLGAALFFDRFDPARSRARAGGAPAENEMSRAGAHEPPHWRALSTLPAQAAHWRPLALLRAELRLLLKRRAWWWYGVVGVLWIVAAANDVGDATRFVVPVAWLWAITAWSELGARAQIHGTHTLLDSAVAPLTRQMPMQWAAGTLLGLALVAPLLLKLALTGDFGMLAQVAVGGAFVTALACACGAASGSARLFELVFLMLVYAALQGVPGVAIGGRAGVAFAASDAPGLLIVAALLFAIAGGLRRASMLR